MSEFKHIMLDIETKGSDTDAAIVSIGALEFDIETGKTGKEFYVNVDFQSSIDLGLSVNASTIMWWLKQNEQARKDLTERSCIHIAIALLKLREFITTDHFVWANSPRFDCGILQNAYKRSGLEIPWDFRKERCVRTLVAMNPEVKRLYKSEGPAHNALSDCYYQVAYCCGVWNSLTVKTELI